MKKHEPRSSLFQTKNIDKRLHLYLRKVYNWTKQHYSCVTGGCHAFDFEGILELFQIIKPEYGENILDIGAGTCQLLNTLSAICKGDSYGIDIGVAYKNLCAIDSQIVSQCPIVKQKWKEMMDSFIVKAQVGTKKEQREKLIQFYCYFS